MRSAMRVGSPRDAERAAGRVVAGDDHQPAVGRQQVAARAGGQQLADPLGVGARISVSSAISATVR